MANPFQNMNADNEKTKTRESTLLSSKLTDIGKVLNRQAELKGFNDTAMFKRLDSIFDQFVEDVADEQGAGLTGASSAQMESFDELKKLLVDMKKSNGAELEKYRQEVSKLLGKVSTLEGPEKNKVFIQQQAKNILEQTEDPILTKPQKFGQAIAGKLGMKDFSFKSFFDFDTAFEKDSVMSQVFGKSTKPKEEELANLEGQLQGLSQEPKSESGGRGRYDRFRGFSAMPQENIARKEPLSLATDLKISSINVDKIIAKSFEIEKTTKERKPQPQPRDEKGRFVSTKTPQTSSILNKASVAESMVETPDEKTTSEGPGFMDKLKKFLPGAGAGAAGLAATVGTVAVGGAAASGLATGLLSTPMQEENRKALRENSMLGAMSGDTAMAGSILDANEGKTGAEVRAEQAKERESLKDAPWYTRIYGVGKSKYLAEKGEGDSSLISKKDTLINAAPETIKQSDSELAALNKPSTQPIVVQAPAAPAPVAQPSIVMPIKGNVRPNESALEKMQSRTFTR